MGVWFGGSVGQWLGLGQMTKNLINFDLNQDNSILFQDNSIPFE